MLTQKFGLTMKEHYCMLRYFLEWSICQSHGPSLYRGSIVILRLQPLYKAALLTINAIQFFFRRIFTQKKVPREGNAFVLDKQHDCHDARCTASSKTLLKTVYNEKHFAKWFLTQSQTKMILIRREIDFKYIRKIRRKNTGGVWTYS